MAQTKGASNQPYVEPKSIHTEKAAEVLDELLCWAWKTHQFKAGYIAASIGVEETTMTNYRKGNRALPLEVANKVDNFLGTNAFLEYMALMQGRKLAS